MGYELSIDVVIKKTHDLLEALWKFLHWRKRHRATHIVVIDEKGNETMGTPLANTDTRRLSLVPKDDKQKTDSIQPGTMVATSLDEAVATIALDPANELEAVITPVDGAQSDEAKFEFKADADLGEGVVEITGAYSCAIVDQMATVIDVEELGDTPKP